MCSIVILRRPGHAWPLLLAANRDEMLDRPAAPPDRHWPDRPRVVAGLDRLAGGSWLGLNDDRLLAAMLNRQGSLGPLPGRRSRGELVLEALDHAEARSAAAALGALDPRAYRSFNMVVADAEEAFWLRHGGETAERVEAIPLPAGLSMITAADRNDPTSPRIRLYLPRFQAARPPDPEAGDWTDWEGLLASRETGPEGSPYDAMAIVTDEGFGTVSSSLLALPAAGGGRRPVWRFVEGLPGERPWRSVTL